MAVCVHSNQSKQIRQFFMMRNLIRFLCFFFLTGISLSIQQFGDYIQLGVISDAQIHPLHMKLSEGWTKNLEKLL